MLHLLRQTNWHHSVWRERLHGPFKYCSYIAPFLEPEFTRLSQEDFQTVFPSFGRTQIEQPVQSSGSKEGWIQQIWTVVHGNDNDMGRW